MKPYHPFRSDRFRAIHEAGHGVIALHYGLQFESIDITLISKGENLWEGGGLRGLQTEPIERLLDQAAGGFAAHRIAKELNMFAEFAIADERLDRWITHCAVNDAEMAMGYARKVFDEATAKSLMARSVDTADRILRDQWAAVEALAVALIKETVLSYQAATAVYQEALCV